MPQGPKLQPNTKELHVVATIAAAMRERGVTQAQLAGLIGISRPQVTKILAGDKPMTLTEMLRACEALGLVASEVLKEAGY